MHLESQPGKSRVLLLILAALTLYLLGLEILELRGSDEAIYAELARALANSRSPLNFTIQGVPVQTFPLYPWLVSIFSWFRAPTVWSLRLPAVLSVFGLAALAAWTANFLKDRLAAFVAASVVLFSYATLRTCLHAQSEIVHAFLLSAAWFSWYCLGPQRQRWATAWGTALGLVFLDVLTVGSKAILLFYLPYFFARKPPQLRRQMQSSAHWLCLCVFILLLIVWFKFTGNQPFWSWDDLCRLTAPPYRQGFFRHLCTFPLKTIFYLLPWSFFAWVPFCEAHRQFEPSGSSPHFFRTVITVNTLLYWLMPSGSPLNLLPLLGPLAVLIGFHFEIASRRYYRFYSLLIQILGWLTMLTVAAVTFVCLAPRDIFLAPGVMSRLGEIPAYCRPPITLLALLPVVFLSVKYLLNRRAMSQLSLSACLILAMLVSRLTVIAAILPLESARHDLRRHHGLQLANVVPPDDKQKDQKPDYRKISPDELPPTIYLHSRFAFLTETFYLQRQIIRLANPAQDLKPTEEVVFLLSPRLPAAPSWNWEPVSPQISLTRRGTMKDASTADQHLRLYRGVLKQKPAPEEVEP